MNKWQKLLIGSLLVFCNCASAQIADVTGIGEDSDSALRDAKRNAVEQVVGTYINSEYAIELNETLQNMGITDAFDETKADFTGIGTSDKGNLSISNVIHKTFISVDEQGTKAGAATLVGISECAAIDNPSKTVYLDRPFVYAIINSETNLPVFLGITDSVTD